MLKIWKQKILQTLEVWGPKPLTDEVLTSLVGHESSAVILFNCTHVLETLSTREGLQSVIDCQDATKTTMILFLLYDVIVGLTPELKTPVIQNILKITTYEAFNTVIHILARCGLLNKPHDLDNLNQLFKIEAQGELPRLLLLLNSHKKNHGDILSQADFETYHKASSSQSMTTTPFNYFSSSTHNNSPEEVVSAQLLVFPQNR
jgi:hypothetical protein